MSKSTPVDLGQYYSVEQLADLTGESVAVWRKRVYYRHVEHVKFGRNVRVSREALGAFIAARRISAVPGAAK